MATLQTVCAAPWTTIANRPLELHVVDFDAIDNRRRPSAALTVVVVLIDDDASKFPNTMRTTMTLLGVSAGVTTASQLAGVAVTAAADDRDIAGIIVADPEPTDGTTGRAPQLTKVGKPQTARPPERARRAAGQGNADLVLSEPTSEPRMLPGQDGRPAHQDGR
jgi:hypothetical protein